MTSQPNSADPQPPETRFANGLGLEAPTDLRLSILTPVFRYDPTPIAQALARTAPALRAQLEWIVVDDGSGDEALAQTLTKLIENAPFAAQLIRFTENQGRATARNRLVEQARAPHVLFLDADMIPDDPQFAARWHALIAEENPTAAFGGFSVAQAQDCKDTALHKFMSARSDCRPAAERAKDAAQFTATSNLLVRRDVLAQTPFDDGFKGWGWEDVDWALRVSTLGPIRHINNPATHAGLDSVPTLLRKFNEAGPNYARLVRKHPEATARFASYRAVRIFKRLPGHRLARPLLAALARHSSGAVPMLLRHAALKLYRTSIYAEHAP
jgi:glycosyltransferase involved in cell wall biosynthesis